MHPKTVYLIFTTLQFGGLSAHATSYTPFMLSIGLTFEQVEMINVWFTLSMLLSEIPTGRIADHYGRSISMRVGAILTFLGSVTYGFTETFIEALFAEILLGIALACFSGATNAWITDALKARNEMHLLPHVEATALVSKSTTAIGVGIIGAFVAHMFGLRAPFWIETAILLLLIVFSFRYVGHEGDNHEELNFKESIHTIIELFRTDRSLIWITLVSMTGSLAVVFNHLWSPFFLSWMSQAWLGAIYTFIQLILLFGGLILRRVNHEGRREVFLASIASMITGIGFIAIGQATSLPFALGALALHELGRVVESAVIGPFVQHRIKSSVRATFSSSLSVMTWIGKGSTLFVLSLTLRHFPETTETIRMVWFFTGIVMMTLGTLLFALRPKDGRA